MVLVTSSFDFYGNFDLDFGIVSFHIKITTVWTFRLQRFLVLSFHLEMAKPKFHIVQNICISFKSSITEDTKVDLIPKSFEQSKFLSILLTLAKLVCVGAVDLNSYITFFKQKKCQQTIPF